MQPVELEVGQSRMLTVREMLAYDFSIPPFQRPYDWELSQVEDLANDLLEADTRGMPLFLGLVVVCKDGCGGYGIIDGQQRLTSVMLAIAARGDKRSVLRPAATGLSSLWVAPRQADFDFTRALVDGRPEAQKTLSQRRLSEAFDALATSGAAFTDEALLNAQIIVYVSPSLAGATGLFERINLRGKDVCQFDLIKNKLIEWAGTEKNPQVRESLEGLITGRYNTLYEHLDVMSEAQPLDSDKLLKVHWILFTEHQFKSSDKVLVQFDAALKALTEAGENLVSWIERYLDTLVKVAEIWVAVERPYEKMPHDYAKDLKQALLDFGRLARDAQFQPVIVAAILRWGDKATPLVRFCEISSFRGALARKNSNYGRSYKWRAGKQLFQGILGDAQEHLISTPKELIHQLFWHATPYWDLQEAANLGDELSPEQSAAEVFPGAALDSSHFYGQYRHIVHYMFWQYGRYLPNSKEWAHCTREDISPFQDSVWFDAEERFTSWDIEHIYPQNPDDLDTKDGRQLHKNMAPWLNHLGNLTVLPIRDNRKMKNAAFAGERSKLDWLRSQRKVSFNELLSSSDYRGNLMDRPHWGANNCRKRVAQIRKAAEELWGQRAIVELGVGPLDARYRADLAEDFDDDDEVKAA
ncbi:DUF262 domain-containing HNH endonuclease family protein [Achromobacter dolens]|uniref:DUF262 domain-containing protein n=1 Tax=Achromobacter dolens TaxID=1287738 RepID=UPI00300D2402